MTVTTLAYTGAVQTYTVPAGVTFVTLECWGGTGGGAQGAGYAKGDLIVKPGDVLSVYVGGGGDYFNPGWNGGGRGYAFGATCGGGATDVRVAGTALINRVIVAGGSGGSGGLGGGASGFQGGYGGGAAAGTGGGIFATVGGAGATQTTGFALGQGGDGHVSSASSFGAGGGGGGYYGGYGGDSSSTTVGGGGGSGFLSARLFNSTMANNAWTGGNGQVVITALNHPPLAPTPMGPVSNTYLFPTDPNVLNWAFNDADPGDYQTKADVRYKATGDVTWTALPNVATTVPSFTLAAGTWVTGTTYEWQVATYDNAGLVSPWSSSSFATTITALSAPTITTPADGAAEVATPVDLEWTLPAGYTQDGYQATRTQNADGTGTLYFDSSTTPTSLPSAAIPLDPSTGRTDYLRVRYSYRGHWSPWSTVSIVNQFSPPQTPLVLCSSDPTTASVTVRITNPVAGGGYRATVANDVTRTGPDGVSVRIAAGLPPNATFTDLLPGAGLNDYRVNAYASSGATAQSY